MQFKWITTLTHTSQVYPSFRCPTLKLAGGITLPHCSHSNSSSSSCDGSMLLSLTFVNLSRPRESLEMILWTFFLHCGQEFVWVSTHCLMQAPQYLCIQESSLTSFSTKISPKQIAHVSSCFFSLIFPKDLRLSSTVFRSRFLYFLFWLSSTFSCLFSSGSCG